MKVIAGIVVGLFLVSGCVSGNIPHADSQGVTKRSEGPALCKDGSTPPAAFGLNATLEKA